MFYNNVYDYAVLFLLLFLFQCANTWKHFLCVIYYTNKTLVQKQLKFIYFIPNKNNWIQTK